MPVEMQSSRGRSGRGVGAALLQFLVAGTTMLSRRFELGKELPAEGAPRRVASHCTDYGFDPSTARRAKLVTCNPLVNCF
jgi:hypothetical protein